MTNPAIIGTIATCPNCNSMVEISAPISSSEPVAQQVAVGSANVDSEAITEEAINADPGEVADPSSAPQGFTTDDTIAQPALADPLSGPMPPDWQSDRTKRSRQIGLVIALAGSGLLGAVLLFGWFVNNWNADSVAKQEETQVETIDSDDPALPTTNSSEQNTDGNPTTDDSAAAEPTPDGSASADTEPVGNQSAAASDSTLQTPTDVPADTKIDAPGLKPSDPAEMPSDIPGDVIPGDVIPGDLIPGDLIGSSPLDDMDTGPAKTDQQPTDSDDEVDEQGPTEIPDSIKGMIQIIDLGGDQPLPKLDAPATLEDVEIDGAAKENIDPMMIANPPKPINFRSALAIKLGLSPKGGKYPFSDLMLFLSQVSGVPIQIDWVTFDLVGINIRDGVTVERKWNSIGEIVNKVAESMGANVNQDELMMTIAPNEELVQTKLQQLLDITDFGDRQSSVMTTLNTFIVGENNPGVNAKTLQVGKTRGEQQVAVFAVEAMRRMHKLPPKVDDRIFLRWAQDASDPSLDWPVITGGDAGKQINSAVAVAGLLRRIARKNNATCFVNWFDANRRRLSPEQLVMPHMKTDAGKVLADMLNPFELQVRQVDDSHWWLGTEATYDQFPVIVWTPPLGADKEIFVQRITNATSKNKSPLKMVIDPDTGGALMLLPRFIVRQIPKIQNGLNLTLLK